jgi:hypothetical protein
VSWTSLDALGESNDAPSRDQIETYARIRLPSGAADVRARLEQVMTKRTIFVRLSLGPDDLDAFLSDSPFAGLLTRGELPELLTRDPRPDWFAPERATSYLTAETNRSAVLVDSGEVSRPVVYVVARS